MRSGFSIPAFLVPELVADVTRKMNFNNDLCERQIQSKRQCH